MMPLSWKRHLAVNYHYEEGKAWLSQSEGGKRCTALSYAAFEFRLAIERIVFQYWFTINDNEINESNVKDVRSYKRMQNKIFKIGGNQIEIKKHFEFMQLILDNLQIDTKLVTPDLGKLQNYYDSCSELCHITWTIAPKERKLQKQVFSKLKEIENTLNSYTKGLTSFPTIADERFKEIQQQFIKEEIGAPEVIAYLKKVGVWAVKSDNKGENKEFVGTPVEPENTIK